MLRVLCFTMILLGSGSVPLGSGLVPDCALCCKCVVLHDFASAGLGSGLVPLGSGFCLVLQMLCLSMILLGSGLVLAWFRLLPCSANVLFYNDTAWFRLGSGLVPLGSGLVPAPALLCKCFVFR